MINRADIPPINAESSSNPGTEVFPLVSAVEDGLTVGVGVELKFGV